MKKGQTNISYTEFPPEVVEEIGYYVYRLIDPRNYETFYVGKGKGNRVFAHVKGTLKFTDAMLKEGDDEYSAKMHLIKEILDEGKEVLYIIHRWGLKEKEALLVESALIDCYPRLTNQISGFDHEHGLTTVEDLIHLFKAPEYVEPGFKYVIIKVKQDTIDNNNGDRYKATRKAWNADLKKVSNYDYVFSVTNGVVKAVYKVIDWYNYVDNHVAFDGELAPDNILRQFVGKKIPAKYRKKGLANPFLYSK